MWSEGKSASQIAKELGGVTRNAVIGKVHRLGLSNRVGGEPEGRTRRARGARRPTRARAGRRRGAAAAAGRGRARPVAKEPAPAVRPEARAGQPTPPQATAPGSAPRRWPTSPRSPRRPAASR